MCLTPGCNTRIPVRENSETKALSFPCIECGAPSYAKADGSEHYKRTIQRLIPLKTSQDVPTATPAAPVNTTKPTLFG